MTKDHELLDRLDRRAATAATDLSARAAARPVPGFDADRGVVVALGRPPVRPTRRPLLAVAAVVALLVGGAAWWSTAADDDGTAPVTDTVGEPRPYLATDLPGGLAFAGAADLGTTRAVADDAGPLVLFGPDPAHPGLGLAVDRAFALDDVAAGEPVDVKGRPAHGFDGKGLGRHALIVPQGTDGALLLTSPSLGRADLVRIAEGATVDGLIPSVDEASLPDGWRRLGADPSGVAVMSPFGAARSGGTGQLSSYLAGQDTIVLVSSSAGGQVETHASDLFVERSEAVTVRGHAAVLGTYAPIEGGGAGQGRVLSWVEAPGEVLRVTGYGVDRDTLLAVAEGLEPVDRERWAHLVERTKLGDFNDGSGSSEGSVRAPLGEGRFADGTAWRLQVVTEPGDGEVGGSSATLLTVALEGTSLDSSGSSSGSSSSGSGSDGAALLSAETLDQGGRHFASGLVGPSVAAVQLRREDGSVIAGLRLVEADGHRAWVTELVDDPSVLVALDAQGGELDRMTFSDLDDNVTVSIEGTATTIAGSVAPSTPTTAGG